MKEYTPEKLLLSFIIIILLYLIGIWVLQGMWSWIIPDVFSNMVAQNVLPSTITYGQSFKLLALYGTLKLFSPSGSSSTKK